MHTWHRLKDFVLRAGATILSVIAVMYVLQMISFPVSQPEKQDNTERVSLLEAAGKAINPVFRPMGIDQENWHASVGLISGLFAKEAIVGSLQSLYTKQHNEQLGDTIRRHFKTNRAGFAYLLFILLYSPCAAALTMLWKEHGRGWTAFAFVYLTALAWMIATLYYQISNLKSAPSQSVMWIGIISATALAAYFAMYKVGKGKPNAA
jgi:ferrous iron transport protein B